MRCGARGEVLQSEWMVSLIFIKSHSLFIVLSFQTLDENDEEKVRIW